MFNFVFSNLIKNSLYFCYMSLEEEQQFNNNAGLLKHYMLINKSFVSFYIGRQNYFIYFNFKVMLLL